MTCVGKVAKDSNQGMIKAQGPHRERQAGAGKERAEERRSLVWQQLDDGGVTARLHKKGYQR